MFVEEDKEQGKVPREMYACWGLGGDGIPNAATHLLHDAASAGDSPDIWEARFPLSEVSAPKTTERPWLCSESEQRERII